MNRFEQLIEYVINDEEQKARELFHDIVVEKSRQIYENLMAEEDLDEAAEEELDEAEEDDLDEGMMGGDAADDLIDNVETEEEMSMESEDDADAEFDDEAEEAGNDLTGDLEADHDEFGGGGDETATKDDIMNLEDKLDELMAEFEAAMGGDEMGMGDGDGFGPEEGGDAIEMDDTGEMEPGMMEAISLKAAPKPVTSEEGNTNKKSTVAANSGARGAMARPVHTGASEGGKHDAAGAYSNQVKDQPGYQGNGHYGKPGPAPKPKMGANSEGQNNTSPLPSGRKG